MDAATRWSLIEDAFTRAAGLGVRERDTFLAATFATAPELRHEVERLLAAHDSAGDFLDSLDHERCAALLTGGDAALPDQVGRYRIIRHLGDGGMGVVYLAYDPDLDRHVALKLLRSSGAGARDRRLLHEARAASALDHPNVAAIHEIGETSGGRGFIAMAYCEGESLAARIARGPLPAREAAAIAGQVADALAAAHAQNIVHRDVKPSNIIVSADGRARLMDFGVALVGGAAGTPAGTPAYMSPEQRNGGRAGPASDVWALGVLLGEMLTGEKPDGADPVAWVARARRSGAGRAFALRGTRAAAVPRRLVRLVRACLSVDAANRPSAQQVATELRAYRSRQPTRRAALALVGGAAAVGIIGISGWLARQPADAPPAGAILVLPFQAAAPDSALDGMSRQLAIALSTRLDGIAGLRVVDPVAIGADRGLRSRDGLAARLRQARRLGASAVVTGELARTPTLLRVVAVLHDGSDARSISATAPASDEDVSALADSLALALFRSGWADTVLPGSSAAAAATSSVPALRAFLEGEQAIAGARFRLGPEAFARAIEADSTFWLAYLRYWFARSYHGSPVDPSITAAVIAHSGELPEPDRMLVHARSAAGARARLNQLRAITVRHPSYWPAWFELGDHLTHHGAFLGVQLDEARAALRRTVALNPGFVPAWEHGLWTALLERDTAESGRVIARLTELRLDTLARREWDLQPLDYYAYLDHLARTGGEPRDADAAIGARVLSVATGGVEPERTSASLLLYGFHRAQLDLSQRIVDAAPAPRVAAAHLWGSALAWAGRGGWDSAFVSARQYARSTSHPRGALWAYGLAATGAWLGRLDADSARLIRPLAERSPHGRTADGHAELAWLDGLLACVRGDDAALRRTQERLALNTADAAPELARSLAAFRLAGGGDRAGAARALAGLEEENADRRWQFANGARHPFMSAVNRLAAGRWLLAAGDTGAAAALLLLHETDLPSTLHPMAPANMILGSFSLALLSDIEEARGHARRAQHHRSMAHERADLSGVDGLSFEPCAGGTSRDR